MEPPLPRAIPVLFEDDDVLAVDKPEGIATIPERQEGKDSLLALLSSVRPERLYVVHRLDKEASGVILFAKNADAHQHLNDQFATRLVRKTYLALVHGAFTAEKGVIKKPIRQFGSGRMAVDARRGKPCTTEFEIAERLGAHTLVRVFPLTGRRHQIRVHFYSIGHPVVGDPLYGDRTTRLGYPRLMLHAWKLEFKLPSGGDMVIEAPVPESFEEGLASARGVDRA